MRGSLQELVLNMNPTLSVLSPMISNLKNLKISVENTPLHTPKLVTAERGFQAIKEYFLELQKSRLGAEIKEKGSNERLTEDQRKETEHIETDRIDTIPYSVQSKINDLDKGDIISKRFAQAVVMQMEHIKTRPTEDGEVVQEKVFANAFDNVIKTYIEQNRMDQLPDYVKQGQKLTSLGNHGSNNTATGTKELTLEYGSATKIDQILYQIRGHSVQMYDELESLKSRMTIYQLKFAIAYILSYLEDFLLLCERRNQYDQKTATIMDEFDPEVKERKKATFDIHINNRIFYQKIGQHQELMRIFEILSFEKQLEKKGELLYLRIQKNEDNYRVIKEAVQLLKQIQLMNTA